MSIVVLQLPDVKGESESRPSECPYCQSEILQRWGGSLKRVRDHVVKQAVVYRYRCTSCRRTFRHYPEGIDRAQQSQRLRKLAGLCWTLGLSYRGVAGVFAVFGVGIAATTAWRDVQEQAGLLKQKRIWQPVRVLGVDGAWVLGWSEKRGVMVAVDLGTGQPVAIGYVDEKDPQKVLRWLRSLVKRLGVSVLVTDDLFSYRGMAEKLGLEHQVCQFHVRRWVGRALHELKESLPAEWQTVLEEVKTLLSELPPEGSRRLYALWKAIPERRAGRDQPLSALDQLRNLLIRLSEHWESYRTFSWQAGIPWTNNGTEQVIGRMKVRSRTVRGYKSQPGMLASLMLAGSGTF
jgi:DNA-directed RNA polymerase subunit RPC12/RpoP